MITLTRYEFKNTIKKYALLLIMTVIILLLLIIINITMAGSIYHYINNTPTLFYLLGFESTTLVHNNITLIMFFLLIISPVIYFFAFWNISSSFWNDYYYGNSQFFYTMPISRLEYWISKFLIHICYLFTYFIILWGICLTTALSDAKTQVARTIAINQTNRIILGIITTTVLFFTFGLFLGSVKNFINKTTIIKVLCIVPVLLTILPNFINSLVHLVLTSIDSEADSAAAIAQLSPLTGVLRHINPIYLGNPWETRFYGMNNIASAIMIIVSLSFFVSAVIIYSQKNLFTD